LAHKETMDLKARFEALQAEFNEWADKAKDEVVGENNEKLDALRKEWEEKTADLKTKMADWKEDAEDAGDHVGDAFRNAFEDLRSGFGKAKDEFTKPE